MVPIKIIKRYENRKLYDTDKSRYITLEDIARLLRANQDVKVVDNESGEDLTSVTLAQILFEEEKKRRNLLPQSIVKRLLQYGGASLHDFVERIIPSGAGGEKSSARFRRGEGGGRHALWADALRALIRGIEDFQKRIDSRITEAADTIMTLPRILTRIKTLEKRLAGLEKKIDEIKRSSGPQAPGPR